MEEPDLTMIEDAWERTKERHFLRTKEQMNHPIRKMIIERGVGKTVLDVASASCIDYPLWKDARFDYTGLGFTKKFLDHACELYPEIKVVGADAADIPFGDRYFNNGYTKDLLEHLPPEKYKLVVPEMWRVTENRMMIAFYLAPWDKPTNYELVNDLHYKNHYNKDDIMNLLASLDDARVVEVVENIGLNNSALYVVDRVPS